MLVHQQTVRVVTTGAKRLQVVTEQVQAVVTDSGIRSGLCTVLIRHTSASLLIQEPDAAPDLEKAFARLVPEDDSYFLLGEGADDMPAHIRAALTQASISIPVVAGVLHLSRLQALLLWEQRASAHSRDLHVTVMGTA